MIKRRKKQKIVKQTLKTTYFWGPGGVPLSLSLYIYVDKYILEIETTNKLPA